jgi:sugar O-acyltransferase (sialic acid O-acetyltransferase NeuD family)
MKNLVIVGARNLGREVFHLATQCNGYQTDFTIKGFLDDKSDALNSYKNYPPILNCVEDYVIKKDDVFIVALGDVIFKKTYTIKIFAKKGRFFSLIHPSVNISPNTFIGEGVILFHHNLISCDCVIGNHVIVHPFCDFGHDVKIGNFCNFGAYTFLGGFVQIDDLVTIHPHSSVMPHRRIKQNSIVGSGSVVMRNIPGNVTVHGNPAKIIFSEKSSLS